ncbi:MAG: nucleoside-diphosphate sugar epimerase/dehydratase [Kiritimatiellae bacterium]|nr:nucleoside-diphosphate sugar epimerase/dehydratase [Kiritimatiellia bacterium]
MSGSFKNTVSRVTERFMGFAIDTAVMGFAYLFAILLRFEFHAPHWGWPGVVITFFVVAVVQWCFLLLFKCHRSIWKYTTASDVPRFFIAIFCSACVLIDLRLLLPKNFSVRPPLSITLLNAIFVFGGLLLIRVFSRVLRDSSNGALAPSGGRGRRVRRVLLVGAGDAANTVAREMRAHNRNQYRLVGFLDDDPAKRRAKIQGFFVLGRLDELAVIAKKHKVDEVVVAMVVVPREVIRRVVDMCKELDLPVRILPAFHELINGSVAVSRLRKVEIADLLGREESKFDDARIVELVSGKCVMVTGAGGSIGSEIVRQIARMGPAKVILFERFENALYNIDREIRRRMPDVQLVAAVGDVCDLRRVEDVFRQHKPAIIIHAAAHKHVPMMEINAGEALKNNVLGTRAVALAAIKHGAERFVLISTDKAVAPVSVMGITKRMAEMVVQSLNQESEIIFSAVRFGNVLGSSGSVVPLFEEQIRQGGPVTVTHSEMRRYFMTIEEAVHLVLLSITQTSGGEIFVLDMGEPVRIVELAEEMIRLSGLKPYEDVPIVFTGIRAGEKLSEDLDVSEASVLKTALTRIYIGKTVRAQVAVVASMLDACEELCSSQGESGEIRRAVIELYHRVMAEHTK